MTSGVKLSWQIEATDIPEQVEALIVKTRAVYDTVGAVAPEKANYNNSIKVSFDTDVSQGKRQVRAFGCQISR